MQQESVYFWSSYEHSNCSQFKENVSFVGVAGDSSRVTVDVTY